MLFYKGLSDIKDDIIGTLKICFSFDEDFKYNLANPEASYLKIFDGFPQVTRPVPSIIITNSTVTPKIWGIGEEFREETQIGCTQGKEFGGSLDFTISLDCMAGSTPEREQLADRTVMFLHWIAREYLYEGGIVIKTVKSSGEREEEWAQNKLFINTVDIDCWVEWTEIVSYDEVQSIATRMREIRDIKMMNEVGTNQAIDMWVKKLLGK